MKKFALGCALFAQLMYPVHAAARTKEAAMQGYSLPADKDVTVVLMRPAVDVGELQGGGVAEPNAEWTESARANIEAALKAELAGRSIGFTDMESQIAVYLESEQAKVQDRCAQQNASQTDADEAMVQTMPASDAAEAPELTEAEIEAAAVARAAAAAEAAAAREAELARVIEVCANRLTDEIIDPEQLVADYNALHGAVVDSILVHKMGMGPRDITMGTLLFGGLAANNSGKLPTQEDKFEYTLGPGTATLGDVADANYGLFVMTNDQFASGGRKAMQVAGALGCLIGACVLVGGGTHVAYVSLVELETGNIVWFNMQRGSEGDVREVDGAQKMVATILEGMPTRPGQSAGSSNAGAR